MLVIYIDPTYTKFYCFQSKYPAETRKLLLVYELQEYDLVIFDFKHMKHM